MEGFFSIQRLKLDNFKGISRIEMRLEDSLTVLIGANGVGKTSVLQALLASLCMIWQRSPLYEDVVFQLPEDCVHKNARSAAFQVEITDPSVHSWTFNLYIGSENDVMIPIKIGRIHEFIDETNFDFGLPLLVYYAQDRGSARTLSMLTEPFASVTATINRQTSLDTTASSLTEFTSWFFEKEAIEGQDIRRLSDATYQGPELQVIRELLRNFGSFSDIKSRRNAFLISKREIDLTFGSLSAGEQMFLLLVLDLARRLMVANPDSKLSELRGIVCIDEIELHLHPAWQRDILPTLRRIFPSCQFIVTTHSPQVIGSVEAKHVRVLSIDENGCVEVSQPKATKGRDTNYLLQGVFETSESESGVVQLISDFHDTLENQQLDEAEGILRELDRVVEGGSSRVAILRAKLNRTKREVQ